MHNRSNVVVKNALMVRGLNSTTVRWMSDMLATRTTETEIVNNTNRISTTHGCLQGKVVKAFSSISGPHRRNALRPVAERVKCYNRMEP